MNKKALLFKIILICEFCLLFTAIAIFSPSANYSDTERRALKKMPKTSAQNILSGKFMTDFDDYTMDQFPARDNFRKVKANFSKYVFFNKDNHGLYLKDGHLSKLEYPLNKDKVNKNLAQINGIYKKYLSETNCDCYLSIIPDKNYFLKPDLQLDYDDFILNIKENLSFARYIDISKTLSLDSFYFTDQHWKQDCILETAEVLAKGMNQIISNNFVLKTLENPFYGAYYGQALLNVKPDTINYFDFPGFEESCTVTSYNTGKGVPSAVYDMKKAFGKDPYEMFLSGADALITIENSAATSQRELVVFRDSFGSSIIPFLIPSYSKITLVDLRYMQSSMIPNFIEFTHQDVLFLYSTMVLNGF